MAEKVGTIYYDLDLDDSKYKSKANAAGKDADDFGSRLQNATAQLAILGAAAGLALTQVVGYLDKAVDAAVRQQNALMGLASTAKGTGNDIALTTAAAKDLANDGLMPLGDAAMGLKNLLAAGFSLPQAIKLMNAFKDSAAFGRQGSLDFGQAIVGATEGIKNGNSALVDNAGVTKNLSNILVEAGFSAQDLSKATTDTNVRMALFNGILGETKNQTGDAAKLSESFGGAMARQKTQVTNLQVALGTALQPVLTKLMDILSPIIQSIMEWVKKNPQLVAAIAAGVVVSLALAAAIGLVAAAIGAVMAIGAPLVGIAALIAVGVGLLVGGLILLEQKFGAVSKTMAVVSDFLSGVFKAAWEILGGAISELVTTLKPVTDALGRFFGMIGDFISKHAETFKTILKVIGIALGAIVVAPLVIAFGALVAVIKVLSVVIGFIIKHFETIKKVVLVILAVVFAPLIIAIGLLVVAFKAIVWVVQQVWNVLVTAFTAIWSVISFVFNGIMLLWNTILAPVFNAIIFIISSLFQIWVTIWTGIFQVVWTIVSTIAQIIAVIFMGIFNFILNTFLIPLFNFWSAIFTAIWNVVSTVFGAIFNFIVGIATGIWNVITSVFNAIASFIGSVFGWIRDNIISPIVAAYNKIAAVVGQIKDAIVGGIKKAVDGVVGFVSNMVDAGKNLVDGIVKGVGNAKDAVVNKIKEICSGALNAVKSFFGIHSPSRVMASMGNFMMQGLQNGVERAGDAVVNAATSISERIQDGMQDSLSNVADGAQSVVGVYRGMFGQLTAMNAAQAGTISGTVSAMDAAAANAAVTGGSIAQPPVNVTIDQSGIVARSRAEYRDIIADGIEAVNEDLRARGYNEIGDGNVKGMSTANG
jgi:phage-related protein